MEIKELKNGQKFKMNYGIDSIWIAKCLFNDIETKEIEFSLRFFFGLIPFGISGKRKYNDYNFENFKYLNI